MTSSTTPRTVTEETITDVAVERWATAHDPRTAELLTALVRHLHAFARETQLTEAEWMAAIRWLTRTGQISDDKREEFILASDVLGLSMLVVQQNNRLQEGATPATVLGPFFIDESPSLGFGGDMSDGVEGTPLFVHGVVRSLDGTPIPNAEMDVWQADADGAYESQLDVDEARLRAKYRSRDDGSYCLRTIAPKGYAIPMDGPVGELIHATDISWMRPAHVHFWMAVPGYEPLITHLFQDGAEYLGTDVVYGVKEELIVRFVERDPGPTPDGGSIDVPWLEAEYDFVLQAAGRGERSDGGGDR